MPLLNVSLETVGRRIGVGTPRFGAGKGFFASINIYKGGSLFQTFNTCTVHPMQARIACVTSVGNTMTDSRMILKGYQCFLTVPNRRLLREGGGIVTATNITNGAQHGVDGSEEFDESISKI